MRILIVQHEYPPETAWGGIATFHYHLAQGLLQLGHEVHVLSFSLSQASDSMHDGVRVIRIKPAMQRMPWDGSLAHYFFRLQRDFFRKFRELHARTPYDVIDTAEHLAEGYSIIRSGLAPTTVRFYSPWSWISAHALNLKERWYDIFWMKWLERKVSEHADRLTCPSQDLADKVTAFFSLKRKIEIIPNPIDLEVFAPYGPMNASPLQVLFVGRLEPRKGADVLAAAIPLIRRQAPDVEFTFIGGDCPSKTSTSMRAELKELLGRQQADTGVTFKDPVPLSELPRYYNAAQIVAVPSRYDTSPYVCQEAMACGRAVVGTTAGGMPEYLDHGNAGLLVAPDSPDKLARAIIRLAEDEALRIRLGSSARRRTVELYDRKLIAARTCAMYEKAIDDHWKGKSGDNAA